MKKHMGGLRLVCVTLAMLLSIQGISLGVDARGHTVYGISDSGYTFDVVDGKAIITGYTGLDTELTIPSTVSDGDNTFDVTGIGAAAFAYMTGVTSIVVPTGVTNIGSYSFAGCHWLASITLPDSLTILGDNAFDGCGKLTSIDLPNGLVTIGDRAFANCCGLSTIQLPAGLCNIGADVFHECTNLVQITVDSENPSFSSLDGVLYNKDQSTLLICPTTQQGVFTVPDSVESIGGKAFYGCWKLTGIDMPEGVSHIGSYAFANCVGLVDVYLPNSMIDIDDNAFDLCTSIKDITVGSDNLNYISIDGVLLNKEESELIKYPSQKTDTFSIPTTVVKISDGAFQDTNMTDIVLPAGVTTIGAKAFGGCLNLKNISMPDSVLSIGAGAFSNCDALTAIHLSTALTSLGEKAFYDCDSITGISIPSGVSNIGDDTFFQCDSLANVTFSDGLVNIGNEAFDQCDKITEIVLPDTTKTIGTHAFDHCDGLTKLTMQGGVEEIGEWAFHSCVNLTSVILPQTLKSIGSGAFEDCSALVDLTMPDHMDQIGSVAFGYCTSLTSIRIPAGLATIEEFAFTNCTNLKKVSIPSSVTTIGQSAFCHCEQLETATIPSSVTSIGNHAFDCCFYMRAIYFLGDAPSTGIQCFNQCYGLSAVCRLEGSKGFTNPWNGYPTDIFTLEPQCTVHFDSQGGSSVAPVTLDTNTFLSTLPVPQRAGYNFDGWFKEPQYTDRWEIGMDLVWANKTLYAKWTPITYEIKFNGNGSTSGTMANAPMTYDVPKALAENTFLKNGYTFLGWAATSTGSTAYRNKATVDNLSTTDNATVNLYAKWGAPISSAASHSYNSIKISWSAAGNAASYQIYRSTSATGTYSLVHTSVSTTRSWIDTGKVTGKYYYYKVYPVVGGTTYKFSTYKYAKAVPLAPTVTLSKYSPTSIKVTWTGVSGASGYQIYRSTSATGTYTYLYTASSTARSWVNTGRTIGKTYYYKVRAYHLEGTTKVYGSFSALQCLKL